MSEFYKQKLIELAGIYLSKDREILKSVLVNLSVPFQILLTVYNYSVRDKSIIPIEELSQEIKTELWSEAREMGKGMNKEKLINLSKVLWLARSV